MHKNIIDATLKNKNYRKVVYTTPEDSLSNIQVVLMNLEKGEDIPLEVHGDTTQIIYIVEGNGMALVDGKRKLLKPGSMLIIEEGTKHYVKNTGKIPLKLHTVYSPAEHSRGKIQHRQKK